MGVEAERTCRATRPDTPVLEARDLNVHYGDEQALQPPTIEISGKQVTAIIGPSGSEKSTLRRSINRFGRSGSETSNPIVIRGRGPTVPPSNGKL